MHQIFSCDRHFLKHYKQQKFSRPTYIPSSSYVSCHNKPLSGHTSTPSRGEDTEKPGHQSSRHISVTASRKRRPMPRPLRLRRVLTPHSAGLSGVLRRASAFLAFICNYMESKWVHLHSKWGELLELSSPVALRIIINLIWIIRVLASC